MRKLKRKPGKLEEIVQEPIKKKKLIKYRHKKCSFIKENGLQCSNNCVGNGNVCRDHGGTVGAPESMITAIGLLPNNVTRYDASIHPIQFIELSRNGLAEVEIAAQFGVSSQNIKKWAETYNEFSTAYEIGKSMYEAWWLEEGKNNLGSRYYQTGLFKFLTGNKLGWSDKIETKNTNSNAYGVLLIPGAMSVDEWEANNVREDEERTIDVKGEVSNV